MADSPYPRFLILCILFLLLTHPCTAAFQFCKNSTATPIVVDPTSPAPIQRAAQDLVNDIERVTGHRPELLHHLPTHNTDCVLVATQHSELVQQILPEESASSLQALNGQWERFFIQEIHSPSPKRSILLITGSDLRGTIYGIYEVSRRIGVSPWHWWADVPVMPNPEVVINAVTPITAAPSVKYRGIFINDEDWGLHPWASHTFDPGLGDIGPKTYARIFELLLRLRANLLWPAMHEVTRAFNADEHNAQLASRYGILMGSSHAEPMLRNNVREWSLPKHHYNFATHPEEVLTYWDQRIRENKDYENIYTLGMRGIHDSGMTAGGNVQEKVAFLENIISEQRNLLSRHLDTPLSEIPQVFTPYKEVLELYQNGLDVPDEVTLIWPDDNHGYIRHFPTEQEQLRTGGSGIYYHLSYLGSPLAYLWLESTPPGVVWQQMHQAWTHGARTLWMLNVGDIKPAERGIEFFLELAWNIERWHPETVQEFFSEWAAREFGITLAPEIASILEGYYELNFQRRPEHLQWWLPHTRERSSPLTRQEKLERLAAFAHLSRRSEAVAAALSAAHQDAYFQLVHYPIVASAAANQRVFHNELYREQFFHDNALRRQHGLQVRLADERLKELTHRYNHKIASGKWRHFMAVEPADYNWRSYRTAAVHVPTENMVAETWDPDLLPLPAEDFGKLLPHRLPEGKHTFTEIQGIVTMEAEHFTRRNSPGSASWRVISGAGRTGDAVALFPENTPSLSESDASAATLEYQFTTTSSGPVQLTVWLLPTFPLHDSGHLRLNVALNDHKPILIEIERSIGDDDWKHAVLNATVTATFHLGTLDSGTHVLRLIQLDPGVVVDKLSLHFNDLPPSYLGPRETRDKR
ncbi:MAG: glycosyl hydrolase 115 family protein [Puniceicoccaceae bacterium]